MTGAGSNFGPYRHLEPTFVGTKLFLTRKAVDRKKAEMVHDHDFGVAFAAEGGAGP